MTKTHWKDIDTHSGSVHCNKCDGLLFRWYKWSKNTPDFSKIKHCPDCGEEIDWEEKK